MACTVDAAAELRLDRKGRIRAKMMSDERTVNLGTLLGRAIAIVALTAAGASLIACGGGADATGESPVGGRGEGPREPGRPALPTMAVAVEPASRGSIATYYSATASLDPDKQADILARTSGVVERLLAVEIRLRGHDRSVSSR